MNAKYTDTLPADYIVLVSLLRALCKCLFFCWHCIITFIQGFPECLQCICGLGVRRATTQALSVRTTDMTLTSLYCSMSSYYKPFITVYGHDFTLNSGSSVSKIQKTENGTKMVGKLSEICQLSAFKGEGKKI